MQTFIDTNTGEIWQFEDDVNDIFAFPLTPLTLIHHVIAPPTAADILISSKSAKIAELSAACQAQIYAGFQSSALGAAHTYPAKDKDQANLSGSVVASLLPGLPANWTTPFWCEDATGSWSFVQHTAAEIQQVGTDGKSAILAALQKNSTLAAQVMAAANVADVQAIVW